MTFKIEFPDYPADAIPALPPGFVDVSFRNDACPSFIDKTADLHLFIDYPEPAEREWYAVAQEEGQSNPRFALSRLEGGDIGKPIVATDDWAEVLAAIRAHTANAEA